MARGNNKLKQSAVKTAAAKVETPEAPEGVIPEGAKLAEEADGVVEGLLDGATGSESESAEPEQEQPEQEQPEVNVEDLQETDEEEPEEQDKEELELDEGAEEDQKGFECADAELLYTTLEDLIIKVKVGGRLNTRGARSLLNAEKVLAQLNPKAGKS